ncbi:hypothetical protein [Streptomyces violaceusniger]|uniref:Secreted protein n=1 Tax=Streptomyces violaceusniger (strain Tu 4113) TaxID=653045 RepID=G2P8W7_STRV4|nr:hypothetical protein [Streptomyces violaceusniger]AEM87421.1 hypothetical protein Strvi_8098 [Streptomyces violaceusniger Tu 4113]
MARTRNFVMPFAVAIAAGTLAAAGVTPAVAAAPSATGTTQARPFVGCASLYSNKPGRAQIKNICSSKILATVSVDWSWDPDCIQINPGRVIAVTWNATKGKADYAYEC